MSKTRPPYPQEFRDQIVELVRAGGKPADLAREFGMSPVSIRAWVRQADRDFTADRPNKLWVADITYIPTWAGFLYLAVVIDVWSRRVVGWAMADHLRTELVLSAFDMAIKQRRPIGVIHHSDQGCQYTSIAFGKRCQELGVRPSMGSVGDCYDNALCESFFATLECELIDRFTFRTKREARLAVFRWIEAWYNPLRRHSSIGRISPVNFERRNYFNPPRESDNLSTKPG